MARAVTAQARGLVLLDLALALLLVGAVLFPLLFEMARTLEVRRTVELEIQVSLELSRVRARLVLELGRDGSYVARVEGRGVELAQGSHAPTPAQPFVHLPAGGWRLRWDEGTEVDSLSIESTGDVPRVATRVFARRARPERTPAEP